MTARCTSPFFTLAARDRLLDRDDDHVADARRSCRFEPPSTLMHWTRRAPELSATSRLVLHLDHGCRPSFSLRRLGAGRALAVALDHQPGLALATSARHSSIRTMSPTLHSVRFVMRRVLLRAADELLVERMHHATLDQDGDRLVHLVADHPARQDALRHCRFSPSGLGGCATALPLCRMVLMRAMSRRTACTRPVASSWPVARWKRRLNCSFRRSSSCVLQLVRVLARMSSAWSWPLASHGPEAGDDLGLDRQLGGAERQRLLAPSSGDTPSISNMIRPGLTRRDPELRRALAGAHAHLGRLRRDRHVREDADPDAALRASWRG